MSFSIHQLGIMQGRLSPIINNKIQAFPQKNWSKEFKKINKLKIENLEWTLDYKNIKKNPIFLKEGIKQIIYLKKKNYIKIESLTGDCFMQKPFWKKKYESYAYILTDVLNACKKIKIKNIIIPLVDKGFIKNRYELQNLIKICKQHKSKIKHNNQRILFEVDLIPKKVLNFIKKLDVNYFGINYDIGNSASQNYDSLKEIQIYGKYIKNVHIKDRVKYGNTVRLGKGNADFDQVFKALKKINYRGKFTLQTARSPNNKHIEEIKINLRFLSKWFYKT